MIEVTLLQQNNNNNFAYLLEKSNSAQGKITALAAKLFDICEVCLKMPSLPPGAFAACKISEQMKRSNGQNSKINEKSTFMPNGLEYSPHKYNGKFMNAIWGYYNRYSPHNIKSNECETTFVNLNTQKQ